MNDTAKAAIVLAASVVNRMPPDPGLTASLDMDALYRISVFHQISALIASALESLGISDPRFMQERAMSIRKNMLLDNDRKAIFSALDDAHIWHMPLKGVILKEYYPHTGMRQMSDNDIMFDATRANDVKSIMESLGFKCVHFGTGHQDDYQKPPISHFEMHRMLFSSASDERLYRYYQGIEKKLIRDIGFERRFSDEDFYIYMVAHEFKHFYWNGTGLRSLLDIYVFLCRFNDSLNWDYIHDEMKKIGISDFEERNRSLAIKVFGKELSLDELSADESEMLEYFITAGVYGTREKGIQNKVKKSGKIGYIWKRTFLSMREVQVRYPFFYKHKVLLPFLPLYRLIRGGKTVRKLIRIVWKC